MEKNDKQPKQLKEALFERIEAEKVCPKPRLLFQSRECLVWFLWILSIIIGALAVAVSLFVIMHHQYDFYEATHENFLTFLVEVLPFAWFFVFGLIAYVSIYNLRHTAHGYRYPVWVIISSSLVLSFAGGSTLQMFGLGFTVDKILGDNMHMYMSQEKLEQRVWQNPEDGRLLGKQVLSTTAPTTTVIFEDSVGKRWQMDVSELEEHEVVLLRSEMKVKLIGKTSNPDFKIFHACGAFPWMMDRETTLEELNEERKAFVEKVSSHAIKARQLFFKEKVASGTAESLKESICAEIAPVKRMPIRDLDA
ncbi:hypothetical protein H6785_03615 [Candidatus Nomurabacteria bacterium]|nr:hypothetical protein [Candidatus Kaiserbacteria bacterium]MCB9815635.1 hypothetical protein [Candidatus Nomurabacteria bacterium]